MPPVPHLQRASRRSRTLTLGVIAGVWLLSVQCSEDPATPTPDPVPFKLSFTSLPASPDAGTPMTPVVRVTVQDDEDNTATGSSATISLAIGGGSAGAVLDGTLSRPVVGGVATFDDLAIDRPGSGYVLIATAAGLTGATSAAFDVARAPVVPTRIDLTSDPGDYIGQGQAYAYTQASAFIGMLAAGGRLTVTVLGDENWIADFAVPDDRLAPGAYTGLQRYPFHVPEDGGLNWSGEGRGCNTLTGAITIDRVSYTPTGELATVDLQFEQHCEGGAPALHGTIHLDANDPSVSPGPVTPVPDGLWQPAPGATPASGNYVYLESEAGDYIGAGQTLTYTPPTAINVAVNVGHFWVDVEDWHGDFQGMNSIGPLQPGYYPDLQRYPFHNPARGGLSWSGQGRGCNTLTGWMVVDEVTYTGEILNSISLRFEQHCEGAEPALHGAIRWAE